MQSRTKRERERESSSRLESSPYFAGSNSTYSPSTYEEQSVISPSLAEGARGWVNPTSALQAKLATANDKNATASNANSASISKANISKLDSVISAKSVKDTHPQTPSAREGAFKVANSVICHTAKTPCHTTISCHTGGEARSISKDSADNAKSIICHLKRSEASQTKQKRDISLALNMTTRKSLNMTKNPNVQNPLDISVSTKPQYDNPIVIASKHSERGNPQNKKPTSRKIALSLLTASALGSASLELAIAGDCVILQHSTTVGATSKRVECTGSFSASEFQ
ncbi:hypothetical protein, partial [Helicobacter sp. MIT 01-3238]|uniref:hypothetical protein n=1 Tax=Helicobacter sp. MIT 01-3238 TaxID=398627 RepID=UPI000E3AD944